MVLIALIIAFCWGGLHALSPGHGKTLVGAYLVGSRSRFSHAVFLGLTVTLTHTIGVFALGLLTLGTSHLLPMEQVYPWLSLLSGALVATIGLNLLIQRLQSLGIIQKWALRLGYALPAYASAESNHHHTHSVYDHGHDHHHDHVHHHRPNHGHHSHLPAADSPISWSSILALGISGGLLPCPSALVVLLSAIAVGRIGFGIALVTAFSLGLAGVLTAIGLILVYAKQWFEHLPLQRSSSQLLPVISAAIITFIGIGLTVQPLLVPAL
jgi:ABC-type nickel/cobalt efflux system permease component RcnA